MPESWYYNFSLDFNITWPSRKSPNDTCEVTQLLWYDWECKQTPCSVCGEGGTPGCVCVGGGGGLDVHFQHRVLSFAKPSLLSVSVSGISHDEFELPWNTRLVIVQCKCTSINYETYQLQTLSDPLAQVSEMLIVASVFKEN